jgi:hypothetical protein
LSETEDHMAPKKTDATTPCSKCAGTMTINMIEPLPMEPDFMQHTFVCGSCGEVAKFKFRKG